MPIDLEPPRQQKTEQESYWRWLHKLWWRSTQPSQITASQLYAGGTANQYLKVNAGTTAFEYASIGATAPIVVAHGTGTTGISHGTSGVAAGTYGGTGYVPQIVVNTTGHVTTGGTAAVLGSMSAQNSNAVSITGGTAAFDALALPKASGSGLKVDKTSPTFGWRDIVGRLEIREPGAADPTFATYIGNIRQFQFAASDEVFFEYHMPHDYVLGTDIHLHVHWSHAATTVTGGTVTFGYEITYSKGHNQAAFITPVTGTWNGTASTTQYHHQIDEVQISAASPSAAQIDSDNLEPDGLVVVRLFLSANNITVSGGGVPDPFVHEADIHYQSSNLGTKQKAPDFYT